MKQGYNRPYPVSYHHLRESITMNPEISSIASPQRSFLPETELVHFDPQTQHLIDLENERQSRKIILIASESICPDPVREAMTCAFGNIYAEGYPSWRMTEASNTNPLDFTHHLAYQRRYADARYYKGCDYVNFVETLAQKRCATLFSQGGADRSVPLSADQIHVNVQALSGAAANNAVYQALVAPGDQVVGLHLNHGGHLTHGSPANRSGKLYSVVPYTVDRKTGAFDYDAIAKILQTVRPRLFIAGASAYPWTIDWNRLRELCDSIDPRPIFLADIAHPAGLVAGGCFPNPVGIADVITFTTHKTLCGPRGAAILTTDPELAHQIDGGVFPGEQGGPHLHAITAKAVGFAYNATQDFQDLMHRVVDNTHRLADALQENGLSLVYGGTDTHLLLIDLTKIQTPTGHPLTGEIASRILDQVGLTCNKNAIPGDDNPAHPGAVRIGTTWATQRGMGPEEMSQLASIISRTLTNIHAFSYCESSGYVGRGKIDLDLAQELSEEVASLATATRLSTQSDPHPFHYPHSLTEPRNVLEVSTEMTSPVGVLHISGIRCHYFLQSCTTNDLSGLEPSQGISTFLLDRAGTLLGDIDIYRLSDQAPGHRTFLVVTACKELASIRDWLRALSDGYTLFDPHDVYRKVEGPALIIDLLQTEDPDHRMVAFRPTVPGFDGEAPRSMECMENVSGFGEIQARWMFQSSRIDGPLALISSDRLPEIPRSKAKPAPAPFPSLPPGTSIEDCHQKYPERFDPKQVYFVGIEPTRNLFPSSPTQPEYNSQPEELPLRRTPLYEDHLKHSKRSWIIPFGGWEMPVRFSNIEEEHRAVRETAGLFDVSHMGTLEVRGPHAQRFLDAVTTNYAAWLQDGQGHYCYLLDPDGRCIDDLLLYRRSWDRYFLVVNASNAERDLAWLQAVATKQVLIDREHPLSEIEGDVEILDLKDPSSGDHQLVDIAFQGPLALKVLNRLLDSPTQARALRILNRFETVEVDLAGIRCLVAMTGYTGEPIGYEIYVHPEALVDLWHAILKEGEPLGVRRCGLGSRDSTRTEAGFPLHGHELAGPYDVTPIEAGYGAFIKLHKPFFIGRTAMRENEEKRTMEIVRFRVKDQGVRMVRTGDPVANRRGVVIGWVTSSTQVAGEQIGLAYIQKRESKTGNLCSVFRLPKPDQSPTEPPKHEAQPGDPALTSEKIEILPRFWRKPDGSC